MSHGCPPCPHCPLPTPQGWFWGPLFLLAPSPQCLHSLRGPSPVHRVPNVPPPVPPAPLRAPWRSRARPLLCAFAVPLCCCRGWGEEHVVGGWSLCPPPLALCVLFWGGGVRAVCCGVRLVAPAAPIKLCEVVSVCPAPVSCPGGVLGGVTEPFGGGHGFKNPVPPIPSLQQLPSTWVRDHPIPGGCRGVGSGAPPALGGPCVCPPPRPFFSTCPSLSPALGSEAGAVLSSSPRGGREEAGAATSPGPSCLAPPPAPQLCKAGLSAPGGGLQDPPSVPCM